MTGVVEVSGYGKVGTWIEMDGLRALFISAKEVSYPPPDYINLLSATPNGTFSHWSVTRRPTTLREALDSARGIDLMHRAPPRRWSQGAYSFFYTSIPDIGPVITEMRGAGVQGGHTRGYNSSSHALCRLAGSLYPEIELMDDDEKIAFLVARAMLERDWQIQPTRPHRAVASTACGGVDNHEWLNLGAPAPSSGTQLPAPTPPDVTYDDRWIWWQDALLTTALRSQERKDVAELQFVSLFTGIPLPVGTPPSVARNWFDGHYGDWTARHIHDIQHKYNQRFGLDIGVDGEAGDETRHSLMVWMNTPRPTGAGIW